MQINLTGVLRSLREYGFYFSAVFLHKLKEGFFAQSLPVFRLEKSVSATVLIAAVFYPNTIEFDIVGWLCLLLVFSEYPTPLPSPS